MQTNCSPHLDAPCNATRRLALLGLTITTLAGWTGSAATLHVWPDSPNPMPPYDSWANAATIIQDAVDEATDGDTVLVAGGVYSSGGRAVAGTMTNRVAIDKAITVESLMGPEVTVIKGAPAPGGGNGDGAIRCVYLGTNAVLSGFTLTNGFTRSGFSFSGESSGGGVWGESFATLTNCIVTGNSAEYYGGGVYSDNYPFLGIVEGATTLYNCTLNNNSAYHNGGGMYMGKLYNCTLTENSAVSGGGASGSTLHNCTLTRNSAREGGGFSSISTGGVRGPGGHLGTLYNCTATGNSADYGGGVYGAATLRNCIVYFNTASSGANFAGEWDWFGGAGGGGYGFFPTIFNSSCTTPMPADGTNNIATDPQLATLTHLSTSSPCVAAGNSAHVSGVDIDGEPWADPPCMGADQLALGLATGALSMAIEASYTHVATGFGVRFVARNPRPVLSSVWDFGDGTILTNQPVAHHVWITPGIYTVRLTGYNDSFPEGASTSLTIEVVEQPNYYVNQANPSPVFPYTSWATAATNIQDAIEAGTAVGRLVLVTNGVFTSGTVEKEGTNRIALTSPVTVRSVNGPEVTMIRGAAGIRCAYLGADASLSGFTLTEGEADDGGGALCEISASLTNCIVQDNTAGEGGGTSGGTLYNCTLTGNSAQEGGGASTCTLYNCTVDGNSASSSGGGVRGGTVYNSALKGNSANDGGGSFGGTLFNCALEGNSAIGPYGGLGGGVHSDTLYNCTVSGNSAAAYGGGSFDAILFNCIVHFNTASSGANYYGGTLNYSCTTPLPSGGAGNITNTPVFVDRLGGNLRLQSNSPCINAGNNEYAQGSTDRDGRPRIAEGTVDMGAYESQPGVSGDFMGWLHVRSLPTDGSADTTDLDGDLMNSWQEWQADTDPNDAASFFHIEAINRSLPTTVSFLSSSNRTYTLWGTPQLAPPFWSAVHGAQAVPGNGSTLTLSDSTNPPQQFYRVQVNVP